MEPAKYPQKTCREPLMAPSGLGYACELPNYHAGPCASFSIKTTVERRDKWEAAHPESATATVESGDIILP